MITSATQYAGRMRSARRSAKTRVAGASPPASFALTHGRYSRNPEIAKNNGTPTCSCASHAPEPSPPSAPSTNATW